ncbi:MAG: bifunctional riboflavin kinase/FAD synthetase [Bacillota bacterium]
MKLCGGVQVVAAGAECALAIGFFDGVHVGHQEIIRRLVEYSRQQRLKSLVLTFDPHPLEVLSPKRKVERITTLEKRVELLRGLGVDLVCVREFDQQLGSMTPEGFVDQVVAGELNAAAVFVGFNFTFGCGAAGTARDLMRLCSSKGISVHVVEPVVADGQVVSSSLVRDLIKRGQMDCAEKFLGRPFSVEARVEEGDGRGRTIGFPTANLIWPEGITMPRRGVYAVEVMVSGGKWLGVANFGPRPTFRSNAELLEVHVLGFSGWLYGTPVEVRFKKWLRPQRAFADAGALARQIQHDIAVVNKLYSSSS